MNVEKLNQFMDEVRDLNRDRFGAIGECGSRKSVHLNEEYNTDKFRLSFTLSPTMVLNPKTDVRMLEGGNNSVIMNKRSVSLYREAHQPYGDSNVHITTKWSDGGDSALLRIEVTQYVLKEENVIDNIKGSIELLFDDIINYDKVVAIKLITHLKHLSAVYHIENVRFPIEYGHYVNLLKDVFENVRILGIKNGINR